MDSQGYHRRDIHLLISLKLFRTIIPIQLTIVFRVGLVQVGLVTCAAEFSGQLSVRHVLKARRGCKRA